MTYDMIDYRGTYPQSTNDSRRLLHLARQLVGQPVLFGGISYPRQLTVHFGTPVEFHGPNNTKLIEGSYVLGACGSAWVVSSAPLGCAIADEVGSPDFGSPSRQNLVPDDAVERFLKQLSGTTVRDIHLTSNLDGFDLRVDLADGSLIEVIPTPDAINMGSDVDPPISLPDWELFTPYKRYLCVGPGFRWSYLPSDQPETRPSGETAVLVRVSVELPAKRSTGAKAKS